ncbi:helix-turn-helix domain-containing protein [Deinococcus geothermalis]|uniref:helix-turn-helix domain-containing protein n=1 Tax=Deinococcus geothermalis TaxID=68909 RepID=UPI00059EB6C8|nr:helix-turn-helix transcriptional regulator [Deinococcus geothermalis]
MEFSEWLKETRKRPGNSLTQTELSRRSGVPQVTISMLERGSAMPRLDTATKLFLALGEVFLPPSIVIPIRSAKNYNPPEESPHDQ